MTSPPEDQPSLMPLAGNEPAGINAAVLDFWRWAYSNLRDNVVRGVFAEWLVGEALGCTTAMRSAWDDYDLLTAEGIRVEVKSAAYLQSWASERPSPIRFSGHARQSSYPTGDPSDLAPDCRADVYVFALLTTKEPVPYAELDMEQWEFWVLGVDALRANGAKSIGLSKLAGLAGAPLKYGDLKKAVRDGTKLADGTQFS